MVKPARCRPRQHEAWCRCWLSIARLLTQVPVYRIAHCYLIQKKIRLWRRYLHREI
ncbi:hypothetical protein E2C01_065029 [Portunus trituberculatus]|uniref:Uncharacterized protein n=1 Tax=Portunus trituberculatus TaxID=210409 RepID=A0A5B7HDE2_PORTR|nr:hypothetical protein [Portunus trituberculatus]